MSCHIAIRVAFNANFIWPMKASKPELATFGKGMCINAHTITKCCGIS